MPHDARRATGCVFVLTDYGSRDEFAGVVRAVVVREAPGASVVDLTHEIPPFDVRAGALALERCVVHLGPGVVLGVVDPGVGTARRPVAVAVAGHADGRRAPSHLVGPDNGLLVWAAEALGGVAAAVELPRPPAGAPATFDGRDLFAPAAAQLWAGAPLARLGTPIDPHTLVRLEPPVLRAEPGALEAEILWIDRFGNVQLAARPADAAAAQLAAGATLALSVPARSAAEPPGAAVLAAVRQVTSFGAIGPGEVGLLVDANGRLALACDRRPAATVLGVREGEVVRLALAEP